MSDHPKHTHIGGQAVIEGIMMRGRHNWAVAVREGGGTIHVEEHDLVSAAGKHRYLRWPIIRGVWGMYETLALAMKAFAVSAEHAQIGGPDAEPAEGEAESLSSREVALTMVLGAALAVGLFVVLPAVLTNLALSFGAGEVGAWARVTGRYAGDRTLAWNVVDGLLRVAVFFVYIWGVGRLPDIRRVFAYHGAEHKTIHAYEADLPLEPSVIQRYSTQHVRCGTSFLLMVMVIAILVFSLVPATTLLTRIASRILLLPLVAGIAYEVTVKWAGSRPDNPLVKVLLWPGLQMQRMTTNEPDDGMVEVAIAAMERVVARERREEAIEAGEPLPDEVAEEHAADHAADEPEDALT